MSRLTEYNILSQPLSTLVEEKQLIATINAHSYNVARRDPFFSKCLKESDVLLPDGISIVWAVNWLDGREVNKIAGADLFFYEMERLQKKGGRCFFLGSSNETLERIRTRAAREFPRIKVGYYSPPYKPSFSKEDSSAMITAVNDFEPNVLFIGLTAPKQEKWAYQNFNQLKTGHVCCIGAVFDFYAGTVERAPNWMINTGLEWLYRLIKEPRRMWRRYLFGNVKFIWFVTKEKLRV